MSLKVWLPLNKDLNNVGLSNIKFENHGATLSSNGQFTNCYYFNGNQQWIQFDQTLGDYYNNDFSVCFWINPTDNTRSIILSEWAGDGSSNIAIELLQNRIPRLYWNGSPDISFTSAGAVPINTWTHLAFLKSGRVIKLYFNGVLKQTYTYSSNFPSRTSNCRPRIGDDYRGDTGNTVSFQGYLEDFRMYDHLLTEKDVRRIYLRKVFELGTLTSHLTNANKKLIFDNSGLITLPLAQTDVTWEEKELKFNGSTSLIRPKNGNVGLNLTGAQTVSVWFTMETKQSINVIFIDSTSKTAVGFNENGNYIIVTSNGNQKSRFTANSIVYDGKTKNNIIISYNTAITPTNCVINGTIPATGSVNYFTESNGLTIGGRTHDNVDFNGKIDCITVYNHELSQKECLDLYNSEKPLYEEYPNIHEEVDLGLPSGNKWATRNLGANNPEEPGKYFAWGETVGYTKEEVGVIKNFNSNQSDYSLAGGTGYYTNYTKYCNSTDKGYNGYTDTFTKLLFEDDAAQELWNGNWFIPTTDDFNELINNTTRTEETINGQKVIRYTSSVPGYEDKSIVFPLAGYAANGSVWDDSGNDAEMYYFGANFSTNDCSKAITFSSSNIGTGPRYCGQSIRPIKSEKRIDGNPLKFESCYDNNYVHITRIENNQVELVTAKLEYRKDTDKNWILYTFNDSDTNYHTGNAIKLNSGETIYFRGNNNQFSVNSDHHIIISTVSEINVSGDVTSLLNNVGGNYPLPDYAFFNLFSGFRSKKAPNLPSTTLGAHCYEQMFNHALLVEIPNLPASALTDYCYANMFCGCTQFPTGYQPQLPSTSLAVGCYSKMFSYSTIKNAPVLPVTALTDYCYESMFYNCNRITTAPNLPSTTLAKNCYQGMFYGCDSLTAIPTLPATTLTEGCYMGMFASCTGITALSNCMLSATTLAPRCYKNMFANCSRLKSPPILPATALTDYCYESMFEGCTSLTAAPTLPSTALAPYCYSSMLSNTSILSCPALPAEILYESCYTSMFSRCKGISYGPQLPSLHLAPYCYSSMFYYSNLKYAPELPATELANGCYSAMFAFSQISTAPTLNAKNLVYSCYNNMFAFCSNLNYIKAMFTTTPGTYYTQGWVRSVKSSGTFVKYSGANWNNSGENGIPNGWSVQQADS